MSIYVIPSEIEAEAMQATPHAELIAQVMNPCVPKTEREWAAQREIERQQARVAHLTLDIENLRAAVREACLIFSEHVLTQDIDSATDRAAYDYLAAHSIPEESAMNDLVERLREYSLSPTVQAEAADEIELLRKQVESLLLDRDNLNEQVNDLQVRAALVAAAEREACAKVCDEAESAHYAQFLIRRRGAP